MAMRIDKYLWCIRVYKTRTLAADACKGGKIKIGGQPLKASYEVKKGDLLEVKIQSIIRKYEVLDFPKSRVAAKDVETYRAEKTDPAEIEKWKTIKMNSGIFRESGTGRPTKKDRRDMIRFFND